MMFLKRLVFCLVLVLANNEKGERRMTERDFCYWLQGYIELNGVEALSEKQVKIIQEHLHLVLNKVTFNMLNANTVLDVPTHLTC